MMNALYEQIEAQQVITNNRRRMLQKQGQPVATGEGATWWACDGALWCDRSHTQLDLVGRWPDDLPTYATRIHTDCRCSVCAESHGLCATPDCGNAVGCDPEEPGESWVYCDLCDADMKGTSNAE